MRAYAVARAFKPLLVNTVVGFIGPEYLYDGKQIIRAGLEDHFCGKILGVPMGYDICYTNHAEADQDDMDTLMTRFGAAGVNFIMGIPGADDVMLNYQSTSFHDQLYLRGFLGLKRAPEFEAWLQKMQVTNADGGLLPEHQPKPVENCLMSRSEKSNLVTLDPARRRFASTPTRALPLAAPGRPCRPRKFSISPSRMRAPATPYTSRLTRTRYVPVSAPLA